MKNKTSNLFLQKFQDIRSELDKLKYIYYLDYSSLQLADVLLNDLKSFKSQNDEIQSKNLYFQNNIENLNIQLKAFKNENLKLIKENNELHRELVDYKKQYFTSNNSKSLEVKKLNEEKNDFKYLYTETRNKISGLTKENDELKNRLSNLLIKIYEGNMNENNLIKLYQKNINELEDFKNSDLMLHVKSRGIEMNTNLTNFSKINKSSMLNDKETINKINEANLLKEAIKQTFTINSDVVKTITIKETSNKFSTLDEDFLSLQGKVDTLENELKVKDSELSRLQKYLKSETPNKDTELMINYLKQENKNIKEKYENRIDYLNNENKKLELILNEMNNKIKNYENHHPFVLSLKRKINNLTKINEENLNYKTIIDNKIKKLIKENEKLKNQIKNYLDKYIEKEDSPQNLTNLKDQNKINKLIEECESKTQIILKLDDSIKQIKSEKETSENSLMTELKNLKIENENSKIQIKIYKDEIELLKKDKEEILNSTNLIQMNILKKEQVVNDFKDKVDIFSNQAIETEKEKEKLKVNIFELYDKINLLKMENIKKEREIERLNNNNFIMEKQILILESKLIK